MRAHHERNLWLSEPDLNCRLHWSADQVWLPELIASYLSCFAPRAGFVTPRQSFVRSCHDGVRPLLEGGGRRSRLRLDESRSSPPSCNESRMTRRRTHSAVQVT